MTVTAEIDWEPIRALAQRVLERGEPLELTDDVREMLRRSAREVAIPPEDTESALQSQPTATTLLEEVRRRRAGADALAPATSPARRLRARCGGALPRLVGPGRAT
jgi:DUSAM domain-containing protein